MSETQQTQSPEYSDDNFNPENVWLRFGPNDQTEETEAEANIERTESGFVVAWYLTAVGLVSRVWFPTYADAAAWLVTEGFQDFTS